MTLSCPKKLLELYITSTAIQTRGAKRESESFSGAEHAITHNAINIEAILLTIDML